MTTRCFEWEKYGAWEVNLHSLSVHTNSVVHFDEKRIYRSYTETFRTLDLSTSTIFDSSDCNRFERFKVRSFLSGSKKNLDHKPVHYQCVVRGTEKRSIIENGAISIFRDWNPLGTQIIKIHSLLNMAQIWRALWLKTPCLRQIFRLFLTEEGGS